MAKFMIIDDEEAMAQSLKEILGQRGYSVRICSNGAEAIELFRRERADLVFCDLKLSGIDGMEVLEALKNMDPWVTVIMITAYSSIETIIRALRLGAYDFLVKPFTVAQIQNVTQQALEYRKKLRQLTLIQGTPGAAADVPARLSELEQLKADFLHLAVQELRTPLNLLNETLQLTQKGFYGDWTESSKQQFLNQCRRVQSLLSRTFQGCLAILMGHEYQVAVEETDVRLLLQQIIDESQLRCKERHLTLETMLPSTPLTGFTDSEKVRCIARELVDNAIHYTPAGGVIRVTLSAQNEEGFQIEVSNDGKPISEEEKEWLFTTFRGWQTSHPLPSQKMGLALVRHYLDLLKGTIQLENQTNQGNRIHVHLSWIKPLPSPVPSSATFDPPPSFGPLRD